MNQTTAKKCPSCGKGYKRRTVLKVLAGLTLLGLVLIVGCVALIGTGLENAIEELNAEQQAHAITRADFRSLELGMTERQVVAVLGKSPEDRQEFESEGLLTNEPERSSCIYYNRAGGAFGDAFQLCFRNGKLESKNAY